jgi:hypothetical protein
MKAMTSEEARSWCLAAGLNVGEDDVLSYADSNRNKFFITSPEEHRRIVVLARTMLTLRNEAGFQGGMLWLRRWDIGSPQLVQVGWEIIEGIRRAQGDLRPLDSAPAQLFRHDELVSLHAFLLQAIAFGWVTDYVPASGRFFVHLKDNRQVRFAADSIDTIKELRTTFSEWNPTDEDPMVLRMRALESQREAEL